MARAARFFQNHFETRRQDQDWQFHHGLFVYFFCFFLAIELSIPQKQTAQQQQQQHHQPSTRHLPYSFRSSSLLLLSKAGFHHGAFSCKHNDDAFFKQQQHQQCARRNLSTSIQGEFFVLFLLVLLTFCIVVALRFRAVACRLQEELRHHDVSRPRQVTRYCARSNGKTLLATMDVTARQKSFYFHF
jgi:hypothetical protein